MKNILIILVILISFILPQDCEEPVEVWFKISNDATSKNYGEIIQIDMSWGFAGSDGIYVYLFVYEKDTRKELVKCSLKYWVSDWKKED